MDKLKIEKLELNVEGLLKLLGGTAEHRIRYWEILKGLTTPAEYRLAESLLHNAEQQLAGVTATLSTLHGVAQTRK